MQSHQTVRDINHLLAASGSFWLLATAAKGEGIPDDQLCVIDPKKADILTRQVTNAGHVKKGIV